MNEASNMGSVDAKFLSTECDIILLNMKKVVRELQFKVLIEQDQDGTYVASVPELPGCYTQGKTLEIARKRIKEAIELVLESDKDIKEEKIESPQSPSNFFGVEEVTIQSYV